MSIPISICVHKQSFYPHNTIVRDWRPLIRLMSCRDKKLVQRAILEATIPCSLYVFGRASSIEHNIINGWAAKPKHVLKSVQLSKILYSPKKLIKQTIKLFDNDYCSVSFLSLSFRIVHKLHHLPRRNVVRYFATFLHNLYT